MVAEDIADFQIEGMSIGESLLDYFSEEEILKEIKRNEYMYDYLKKGKFGEVYNSKGLATYDYISFFVNIDLDISKNNKDNKFIIFRITGTIDFIDDIRGCKKKQNEIAEELSEMLNNLKKVKHSWKDIEGTYNKVDFFFPSGDKIQVMCYDYEESITNKYGWNDGLDVVISTNEVTAWLLNE